MNDVVVIAPEKSLEKAARQLDISPSKYKQAMERFEAMKDYLMEGEYHYTNTIPEIYLQGSFKLGTEIRPFRESKESDYDIDIVCQLDYDKHLTTPKMVKHQVGDLLKIHGTYRTKLDKEGKRCWTLIYAEQDGIGFHMDILPSVDNIPSNHIDYNRYGNPIAVTNKCDKTGDYSWSSSNPMDFSKWFYERNRIAFQVLEMTQKKNIFESHTLNFSSQDEVPDIHVKTPLQRSIQLLKRHRDICFSNQSNENCKPISMIITVLAARAYNNEDTIEYTLKNLLLTLYSHADQIRENFNFSAPPARSIFDLIQRKADGTWHIPNPTNPEENFADRWHEEENGIEHARAKAFFNWIEWAREDFVFFRHLIDEDFHTRALVSPNMTGTQSSTDKFKSLGLNINHRKKPYWPMVLFYKVQIFGRFKTSYSWQEFNSGDLLDKYLNLLFRAETDVPEPFEVYWQVVNTGLEAERAGQLRGAIFHADSAGLGGKQQKEKTEYAGTHWIECFIVKGGRCMARSGEFIVKVK